MKKGGEKDSIVVFLKDARVFHQPGAWNDFDSMILVAYYSNGFACIIIPGLVRFKMEPLYMSVYHNLMALFKSKIDKYNVIEQHK